MRSAGAGAAWIQPCDAGGAGLAVGVVRRPRNQSLMPPQRAAATAPPQTSYLLHSAKLRSCRNRLASSIRSTSDCRKYSGLPIRCQAALALAWSSSIRSSVTDRGGGASAHLHLHGCISIG